MALCALDGRTVIVAGAGQTVFTIGWDATLVRDEDVLLWFEDVSAGTPGAEASQGAGAGQFAVDRVAGTCTLVTSAEVGDIITMERHQSSPIRKTVFTQPGDFIPSVVNNEFDHFLQLIEDLGRDRCRSIRMDRGVNLTSLDLELPTPVAGSAIGWVDATTIGNIGVLLTGLGTLGTIPLWTPDGFTLGDSALVQSGLNITAAGLLTVNSNTDGTTILGRAKIGTPITDVMFLAHFDRMNVTDFALSQTNTGALVKVNSATGGEVRITNNDMEIAAFNSAGLAVTGAFSVSSVSNLVGTLTVSTGDIIATAGDVEITAGFLGVGIAGSVINEVNVLISTVGARVLISKNLDASTQAPVTIRQDHVTGGVACLDLDQDDVSEGFIQFIGLDRGAVPTSTVNGVASARVKMGGTIYVLAFHVDQ